jgi:hypothetical protein
MNAIRQILKVLRLIAGCNLLVALVSPFFVYGQFRINVIAVSLLIFLFCVLFTELLSVRHTRFQSSLAFVGIIVVVGMFVAGLCVGLLQPYQPTVNHEVSIVDSSSVR